MLTGTKHLYCVILYGKLPLFIIFLELCQTQKKVTGWIGAFNVCFIWTITVTESLLFLHSFVFPSVYACVVRIRRVVKLASLAVID